MAVEKDLGPVSAYAVAVAHGYTGTEAEWEALIANSAINAQSAGASATAAAASAQEAAQQKTQAQAQAVAAQAHATQASNFANTAGQANSYAQMASSNAAVSAANASNAQTAAEAAQAAAEAAVTGAEAAQTAAEAAVTDAQTAKTAAETAAATAAAAYGTDLLADDYSTSKTYAVGDYVIYSGNLYRCTTAITTAEAWTAAHWTQAQIGPDVSDLKSAFVNQQENILPFTIIQNEYVIPNGTNAGNFGTEAGWDRTDFIPLANVYSMTVSATQASGYNCYYKADKTFRAQIAVTTTPTTIYPPSDAAYAIFSFSRNVMAEFKPTFVSKTDHQVEINKELALSGLGYTFYNAGQFVAPYDDCDTLPDNSIMTILYNAVNVMDNLPTEFGQGTILTVNSSLTDESGKAQIAIYKNGGIATRHKWADEWSDWFIPSTQEAYTEFSMFPSFAVLGDSFASGTILTQQGSIWGMYPNYAWPNILSRMTGSEVANYSTSGLSTRTWLTDPVGLSAMLNDTPKALYLLCLGINDGAIYNEDSSYLGSVADMKADYTQNPDTFYGNYGRIIGNIKAHAPGASIILIATPSYGTTSATAQLFRSAMAEIAEEAGIPFVSSHDDEYFNSSFYQTNQAVAHPIAITYSGTAKAYKRQVELAMQNNTEYFWNVH